MKKWYELNVVIILFLILFFPVGLFLMWRSNWNTIIKVVVSVFIAICAIGAIGGEPANTSTVVQEEKEVKDEGAKSIEDSAGEIKENIEEIKNDEEVKESFNNLKESVKDNVGSVEKKEPTEVPEPTEDEYKALCEKFDYKDVARNPVNYENKNTFIKGKVIQASEGLFDQVTLRVATREDEYLGYIEDVYLVTYKQVEKNRILQDDMVKIWGLCDGVTTYKSLAGNVTVPSIQMKYYEINK